MLLLLKISIDIIGKYSFLSLNYWTILKTKTDIKFSIYGDREALAMLGARIRDLRLGRNQTQEHIAQLAGVSRPTYRKIEAGEGSVEIGIVARVVGILGFAKNLGEVVPAPEPPVDLKALMAPARQRARGRRALVKSRAKTKGQS